MITVSEDEYCDGISHGEESFASARQLPVYRRWLPLNLNRVFGCHNWRAEYGAHISYGVTI